MICVGTTRAMGGNWESRKIILAAGYTPTYAIQGIMRDVDEARSGWYPRGARNPGKRRPYGVQMRTGKGGRKVRA